MVEWVVAGDREPGQLQGLASWEWVMRGLREWFGHPIERMGGVERFVQLVVVGGLCLVTGLWVVELGGDTPWLWAVGVVVAVAGVGLLGTGIWSQIEV